MDVQLEVAKFRIVVLEKILESPLDSKELKLVNPKGNQTWIFTGRTVAEAEAPILWSAGVKSRLIEKDPNAGKDWRQGTTEDEMVWWHHWLNGHDLEQAPGVGAGQGSLACCSPWGRKELDMTEWLNWTDWKEVTDHEITAASLNCWASIPGVQNDKIYQLLLLFSR